MAVTKNIKICGRQVPFKASAATPRVYRQKFGRDIYRDLDQLIAAVDGKDDSDSLDAVSLEIFENISYVMAKAADPENVPDEINDWLDEFDVFSIYGILPQIISLWGMNSEMQSTAKKNSVRRSGK